MLNIKPNDSVRRSVVAAVDDGKDGVDGASGASIVLKVVITQIKIYIF